MTRDIATISIPSRTTTVWRVAKEVFPGELQECLNELSAQGWKPHNIDMYVQQGYENGSQYPAYIVVASKEEEK